MKVALTVWENRISPLFDAACTLLVTDINNGSIQEKRLESINFESPCMRISRIDSLDIDILICGGISDFYANLIEARGTKIISFVSGDTDDVLNAYINGNIYNKDYRMPGCENVNETETEFN